MPHVQRRFIHELADVPWETAKVYPYVALKDGGNCTALTSDYTSNTYGFLTHRNISAQFYKDLKTLVLQTIEDDPDKFPYDVEFFEDEDVNFVNNQKAPYFTIGTNSYVFLLGNMGNTINTSYIVPKLFLYYNIGPSAASYCYPWTEPLSSEYISTGSFPYYYQYRTLYDASIGKWDYTIHLYYNTDFLVIAYTTPTLTKPISILQQIKAKDRFNRDWYFICQLFGLDPIANYYSGNYLTIRQADDADGKCYSTSPDYECLSQAFNRGYSDFQPGDVNDVGFWFSCGYNIISSAYTYFPVEVDPRSESFGVYDVPIKSPCFRHNTSATGRWPNIECLMQPLEDLTKVYLGNPILFNGLFTMSNQILCASVNILNDAEYEFDGKKYWVFGYYACRYVPFPILFEFDDVEPEPEPGE